MTAELQHCTEGMCTPQGSAGPRNVAQIAQQWQPAGHRPQAGAAPGLLCSLLGSALLSRLCLGRVALPPLPLLIGGQGALVLGVLLAAQPPVQHLRARVGWARGLGG